MARIPESVKEEIRQHIHLPELLMSEGVDLRRAGSSMRGTCPFEPNSTNRSKFAVEPQGYKCFGCGESGDVFTWLQKKRGLDFRKALEEAASIAGIDIEEYKGSRKKTRNPERVARFAALNAAAERTIEAGREREGEARTLGGMDLTPLIEGGEIGYVDSGHDLVDHLQRIGTKEKPLEQTALADLVREQGSRWMLWARGKNSVWAGRPLGSSRPVVGERGTRSRGWVHPQGASRQARLDGWFAIVGDDRLYVALRSSGLENVFRATTGRTYDLLHALPVRGSEPVFLVRPDNRFRKWAYEDALKLSREAPRMRVAEIPVPGDEDDPSTFRDHVLERIEQAGTVFDWQVKLLVEYDALSSERGRQQAARKLAHLVQSVEAPVERTAYRVEMEHLTGIRFEDLQAGARGKGRSGRAGRREDSARRRPSGRRR